jgi:hypothetical protein
MIKPGDKVRFIKDLSIENVIFLIEHNADIPDPAYIYKVKEVINNGTGLVIDGLSSGDKIGWKAKSWRICQDHYTNALTRELANKQLWDDFKYRDLQYQIINAID